MNAIIHASHRKFDAHCIGSSWVRYFIVSRFSEPVLFWIYVNATKRGSEPIRV